MKPLQNKVLIERILGEKMSMGGIILHRSDAPDYAKVLAIGPDVDEVYVGETVLVNWNSAVKHKVSSM